MPDNPWGVQRAAGQFRLLFAITQPVTLGLAVLCLASLVLRFRRSRGVQRQQLKWFTYATLLGFGTWALLGFTGVHDRLADPLQAIVTILIGWLIPVAIGVAILRYRLYDIDRLINRTLVYGLLTALLASVYAGAPYLPAARRSRGGMPSLDRKPCRWEAGALRGVPASTRTAVRRARTSTRAALRPAAPPPTTRTSYSFMPSASSHLARPCTGRC
jgi:hypothetical protein